MLTRFTLFDMFSANLALYRKEYGGLFMCPLCLRAFSRDQVRSELHKAHIIPQRLGGKRWTLTCKRCNNRIGSEIESHETQRTSHHCALTGVGNEMTRVRIVVRNSEDRVIGSVQAKMRVDKSAGEPRGYMCLQPKASNPVALNLLNRILSGETSAGRWDVEDHSPQTRVPKRANLTYVHAAHLLMFHHFGYEWVLNPCAELIRRQLMSPDEPIILPLSPAFSDHHIPDEQLALLLITEPAEWRNFAVVLPLLPGRTRRYTVWMPLFGRPYTQPPKRKGVKLQTVRVPDHHQFLDRRDSQMQGFRFVLSHFSYDAVLYSGRNWFQDYR